MRFFRLGKSNFRTRFKLTIRGFMHKVSYKKVKQDLVLSALICITPIFAGDTLTVGFWNVENVFDLEDDPYKNDNEFAIGGKKRINKGIYNLKMNNIASVISKIGADVLGLCEIENEAVLKDLDSRVPSFEYQIVHYESADFRGIDVALFYNPEKLWLVDSRKIKVLLPSGKPTRDILHATLKFEEQILHVFVNHWPSKYGGVEKTIPFRAAAARTLRKEVERLLEYNPNAEIVIMGDLNDEPIDPSIVEHLGANMDKTKVNGRDTILWNVMEPYHRNKEGSTYKYGGKDMVYDHLIISSGLWDEKNLTFVNGSERVFDGPEYRQHVGKYDGSPFRFWAGNKLLGGYSDHMPIYLKIYRLE